MVTAVPTTAAGSAAAVLPPMRWSSTEPTLVAGCPRVPSLLSGLGPLRPNRGPTLASATPHPATPGRLAELKDVPRPRGGHQTRRGVLCVESQLGSPNMRLPSLATYAYRPVACGREGALHGNILFSRALSCSRRDATRLKPPHHVTTQPLREARERGPGADDGRSACTLHGILA